jgi:hypothetical protein
MIDQKFAELERAAEQFKAALLKFQSVYDPETVGIVEFCEQIDEVLFDIDEELQERTLKKNTATSDSTRT